MIFLNITNATKNMAVNKIKDFFSKTIIKELDFLEKAVI